jgi:hypothetical protein
MQTLLGGEEVYHYHTKVKNVYSLRVPVAGLEPLISRF